MRIFQRSLLRVLLMMAVTGTGVSGCAFTRDGLAADYVSADAKSFSVNFGWPLSFVGGAAAVAPHGLVLGGQVIGVRMFEVAFDSHNVVVCADFISGPASQIQDLALQPPEPSSSP